MRQFVKAFASKLCSKQTLRLMYMDYLRLRARLKRWRKNVIPPVTRLHLGCGLRHVPGWLNVDVAGSEFDVDLCASRLPWVDGSFDAIVSQHVVEHLELHDELLPLLKELRRVSRPGAEIWLSCPDLAKVCQGYLNDLGAGLLADRRQRFPKFTLDGAPVQQMVNWLFHQRGEHKNLFDFELLRWALEKAGFSECQRGMEEQLLARFPEFPRRDDDYQSLYVSARVPKSSTEANDTSGKSERHQPTASAHADSV